MSGEARGVGTTSRGTALITGASSGLGEAFARKLASQKLDLILVARRGDRLAKLASELRSQCGVNAEDLVADLSTDVGVGLVERRIESLKALDLLVNNAGFGVPGEFAEVPLERSLLMIDVHVLASVRLSRAALPGMIARRRGAIINVSSIGAFLPRPGDAVYCATKAYLNAFSEALAGELRGSGVQMQALCPGFVPTEFLDQPEHQRLQVKARIPKWLWTPAEDVIAASLQALRHDQLICVPGFKNRLIVVAARSGLAGFLLRILARRLADQTCDALERRSVTGGTTP